MKQTVELYTYDGTFEVETQWLENNIESMSLNEFLSTYTWDEGEWLHIMYSAEQDEKAIAHLAKQLKQGYSLFKNGKQEGILHASNKGYEYQFSYFDEYGAVGDLQENTLEKMARKIYELGFRLCDKSELKIIK